METWFPIPRSPRRRANVCLCETKFNLFGRYHERLAATLLRQHQPAQQGRCVVVISFSLRERENHSGKRDRSPVRSRSRFIFRAAERFCVLPRGGQEHEECGVRQDNRRPLALEGCTANHSHKLRDRRVLGWAMRIETLNLRLI